MFDDATWLHAAGRLLIAAYFVMALPHNVLHGRAAYHIAKLESFHVPFPALSFWIGMALQTAGAALLVAGWHVDLGIYCLIPFTLISNGLYNRYWTIRDPMVSAFCRMLFGANTAVLGGLLLLLANLR
jgi:uncharacterized membrane protein YphA (DoxX/SURF4 family)